VLHNVGAAMSKSSLMAGKTIARQLCALQTKVPDNNFCLVCQTQGPAYVCINFKTFVCQACADIHREFGYKTASIMHSEWDQEDYTSIEKAGGNKRAAAEWLAFYNPEDFPRPASSDGENVRAFIRKAFMVKCWQRQPKQPKRPKRTSACRNVFPVGDGGVQGPSAFPPEDTNWAHFPPVDETGPFDPSAPSAGGAGPWPHPEAFVPLPTIEAYFCCDHDTSERRPKDVAAFRICRGCSTTLNTNYVSLVYCPTCSNQRSACLICGAPGIRGVAGASRPEQAPKSFSREGSESTEAPATSAGNLEGESRLKADFSSDGEGLLDASGSSGGAPITPVGPPPSAASAPTALQGSLLDFDFEEDAVPQESMIGGRAVPAPPSGSLGLLPVAADSAPPAAVAPAPADASQEVGREDPFEAQRSSDASVGFLADFSCLAAEAIVVALQEPAPPALTGDAAPADVAASAADQAPGGSIPAMAEELWVSGGVEVIEAASVDEPAVTADAAFRDFAKSAGDSVEESGTSMEVQAGPATVHVDANAMSSGVPAAEGAAPQICTVVSGRLWDDPFKDCDLADVPDEPPMPSAPPTAAQASAAFGAEDSSAGVALKAGPADQPPASAAPLAEAEPLFEGMPVAAEPPAVASASALEMAVPDVMPEAPTICPAQPPMPTAPPAPSAAEEGLRLCEEVLRGNTDALFGLLTVGSGRQPPVGEEVMSASADPWAAFDMLRAPGAVPASGSAPGRGSTYPQQHQQPMQLHATQTVGSAALPSALATLGSTAGLQPSMASMPRDAGSTAPAGAPTAMASAPPFAPPASSSFMPDEWIQSSESPKRANTFSDILDAFHKKELSWEASDLHKR